MKLKATLLAAGVAVLSVLPLGASASACDPEHNNPCDLQPYELPPIPCKIDPRC